MEGGNWSLESCWRETSPMVCWRSDLGVSRGWAPKNAHSLLSILKLPTQLLRGRVPRRRPAGRRGVCPPLRALPPGCGLA